MMNEIPGTIESVSSSGRDPDWQLVRVVTNTGLQFQVEVSTQALDALRLIQGDSVVLSIPGEAISIGRKTSRIEWGSLAPDQFQVSVIHVDSLSTEWDVQVKAINRDPAVLHDFLTHSLVLLSSVPISNGDYERNHELVQPFDNLEPTAALDDLLQPQLDVRFKLSKPGFQGPVRVRFIAELSYSNPHAYGVPSSVVIPTSLRTQSSKPLVVKYRYDTSDTSDSDVDIGYSVSGAAIDLYLGTSTSPSLPHRGPLQTNGNIKPPFSVTKASSGTVTVQAKADTRWYRLMLDINTRWS
jgi:hypothetical protein